MDLSLDDLMEIYGYEKPDTLEQACGMIYEFLKIVIVLQEQVRYIHELIPTKYKKAFPKKGENPYFTKAEIDPAAYKPTIEDYINAKIRMGEILKNIPTPPISASSPAAS